MLKQFKIWTKGQPKYAIGQKFMELALSFLKLYFRTLQEETVQQKMKETTKFPPILDF